jgi:Flp pilus assembly protein TadG
MRTSFLLWKDDRGGAATEFAFAAPVLISFVFGIAQLGMVFLASAGMQHALGEAARYATLCLNPTVAGVCSAPTDSQLTSKVTSTVYGTNNGTLNALSITNGPNATAGNNYKDLSLTYSQATNFVFITGPTVTITRSKRVYLSTTS